MQRYYVVFLLVISIVGCQDAAARQRAAQAQRAATARKLKQIGQEMHNKQSSDSTPASPVTKDQQKSD